MNNIDNDCPRFRPFVPSNQRMVKVKKAKYSTSLDPRGYIPVYEYTVNGQPIMWDRESGYVHFTGIWKALGNSKADIVKMVDSNPDLKVKKIRGGFLKIQGTWIPYSYAYTLCKRTAWNVRKELAAMFGPRFVTEALPPSHIEYGCLLLNPHAPPYQLSSLVTRRNSFIATLSRRDYMKKARDNKPPNISHRPQKSISSMSLSRLLNDEPYHPSHGIQSRVRTRVELFTESPNTTPSPTFRAIPSPRIDTNRWPSFDNNSNSGRLLPPIFTNLTNSYHSTDPRITPIYNTDQNTHSNYRYGNHLCSPHTPPSETTVPSFSSAGSNDGYSKDIIETINATILLQRLSQDDGARPFKPMHPNTIPSKVMVGDQEFRICWDY
ncbi:transcription regulator HTH, apses-type DNA-binding domain-containing protein [Pilobolus umbonatus]|nr:transcription regulator HTH, apses-type DNA-binding domain-containing protein [Pilobolus umbonatus]